MIFFLPRLRFTSELVQYDQKAMHVARLNVKLQHFGRENTALSSLTEEWCLKGGEGQPKVSEVKRGEHLPG